jgi:ATP/ADP translocase
LPAELYLRQFAVAPKLHTEMNLIAAGRVIAVHQDVTDTLGYRTGDQLGAWSYSGMHALGLTLSSISFIAVPVVAGWCVLSLWLGRKQVALASEQQKH